MRAARRGDLSTILSQITVVGFLRGTSCQAYRLRRSAITQTAMPNATPSARPSTLWWELEPMATPMAAPTARNAPRRDRFSCAMITCSHRSALWVHVLAHDTLLNARESLARPISRRRYRVLPCPKASLPESLQYRSWPNVVRLRQAGVALAPFL